MKKLETNTLRIEPRKFHASAVGIAMMIAYLNYYYIIPAFRIAFPPIGLDTVVVVLMGVTLNALAFELRSFFWALSVDYIHGSGSRVLTRAP